MKTVIVASTNPVKVEVARRAFATLFPHEQFDFVPVSALSGVPDQPYEEDTRKGAEQRLAHIKMTYPEADYWISQEGGLYADGESLFNMAWIIVENKDGAHGRAATARMYLPSPLVKLVKSGMELGHAGNEFFNEQNIKHGNGVIGHLSNGTITRADYYTQAAILALSQVVHHEWFSDTAHG